MKKSVSVISCALALMVGCVTFAACNPYDGDYDYEAIDPGTLAAPTKEFVTAEEDAAKNAEYRAAYPTL
ncbi:MAG: hypothetical protein K2J30_06315, partial [Clostridia bacterium]|nr:hypothetical protein [Clostridia bacterium]